MRRLALDERKNFLDEDLSDALKGLFVGAVVWVAADTSERCPFQKGLGMFTSLVQARALYEFYSPKPAEDDDARASHFAPNWRRTGVTSLYTKYMGRGMPANKRVFHLVYGRSAHAGGPGHDGPDHIKNQVLEFAKDLRHLTQRFAQSVDSDFRESVERALGKALAGGAEAANGCGIINPL
jgi:hypothetical protein